MKRILPFACLTLLMVAGAQAAEMAAPAPQSKAQLPSTDAGAPQKFSLGVGTGINTFGGNMGKLYSSSSALVDVRGQWAFAPMFAVRMGGEFAKYSFNAAPNGPVDVSTQSLGATGEWHFISTALEGKGFDPYALAGLGQVFRTQNFSSLAVSSKDSATAVTAGFGTNYLLDGGKLGFWLEADASQVFFQDRFDSEYAAGGIMDLTGPLYSARAGVKYVF